MAKAKKVVAPDYSKMTKAEIKKAQAALKVQIKALSKELSVVYKSVEVLENKDADLWDEFYALEEALDDNFAEKCVTCGKRL